MSVSMTGRLSKRSEDRPPDGEFGAIAQLGERLHGMQEVDGLLAQHRSAQAAGQADKVAKIAAEYNALTARWGF